MTEVPKKGYSIWSLLVIMTLLAVWLAVPRKKSDSVDSVTYMLFIFGHQLMLWIPVAVLMWMCFGKRRVILYALATLIALLVLPLLLIFVECKLTGDINAPLTERLLSMLMVKEAYVWLLSRVVEAFRYEG